jgi:general secretion pathway protein G
MMMQQQMQAEDIRGKATKDIARAKIGIIENGLERFALDCGRYPDESEGLEALFVAPEDLKEKWNGPYLKKSQLNDPWGNPYVYVEQGKVNPGSYDLISFGADGEEGGEGENGDIFND